MTLIDALGDRNLFGGLPAFRDLSTWRSWVVLLKAVYGLELTAEDLATFRRYTGRATYQPPPGGWREVACIVGRQSGKSRIASLIAAFEAMTATPEADRTDLYALVVAQDARAALRTLFSYAKAPFELVPILKQSVVDHKTETLRLSSGVVLAAYPCRPPAVRGLRSRVVVLDELAFFRSTENLPQDTEMLRAIRPTLATTNGKLIILSSPYGQTGALWDLHRKHFGRDDARVLVWQASAPDMNPTLSSDYLARMEEDDPEAYRAEVLGEFRAGLATFLDPEAIQDCVADGVTERPPIEHTRYVAFADPSGGRHDRFTLALAHVEQDRAILDVLRAWAPPFNPSGVIEESADILKRYRVTSLTGDRYSAEFVVEQFRSHNLTYTASDRDASSLYLELLPLVNAQRARLLDHHELLKELRGLERRRGTSGKDRVTHRPGAHDDLANATAGVLVLTVESVRHTAEIWMPDLGPDPGEKLPGPEQRQLINGFGLQMFTRPTEFTCGNCASFDAEATHCTLRKFRTQAPLPACEAYQPRLLTRS